MKRRMNPKARGKVDLILTGSYSTKLFVRKFKKRAFIFDSRDPKRDKLVGKYGLDIMGLNIKYWEQRQRKVYADMLIKRIKQTAKIG